MDLYQSLSGMVRVELTCADIPAAFGRLSDAGIPFYDSEQKGELTTAFTVHRRQFRTLKALCEKQGYSLKILGRKGLYWSAKSMAMRPVMLLGVLCLLFFVTYLPSRVFFVEVEGNVSVPSRLILAAAEESGIRFGASRREVRSEKVKNALLEAVPQLQWAGVNTYGCVARISVRERSESEQVRQENGYGSIVAIRDGVITSCTATKGNLICGVGQAVTKGEVLISGYTDCGICIRLEQAQGEVYAQTIRDLTAVVPSEYEKRTGQAEESHRFSLLIGKKRINLWKDSGIQDASCGRMYKEYYITLPGGFQLPAALAVETYTAQTLTESTMSEEEAGWFLSDFAKTYLKEQMVAGTIQLEDMDIRPYEGCFRLDGQYVCVEMIGSMQREQIGEENEQTS